MKQSEKVKREFLGVWIPKQIWLDYNLTWMEKLFLTEIESLDNEKGCFASNAYFAEFFNLSITRPSHIIKSLINKKYLSVEYIYDGKQIKQRVLRKLSTYLENAKDNNKQSLSKDKEKGFEKTQNFKTSKYLDYWNSKKENFSKIQLHTDPNTKTYQRAVTLIKHLLNGTFGEHCYIDREFMKKNHIKFSLLEKKWTEQEIKLCITRLPMLFVEGYWPLNKNNLPRDLSTLIHNPRTNVSWFLHVFTHPPHPTKEKTDEQMDNEKSYKTKGKMTEEEYHDQPLVKEADEFLKKYA